MGIGLVNINTFFTANALGSASTLTNSERAYISQLLSLGYNNWTTLFGGLSTIGGTYPSGVLYDKKINKGLDGNVWDVAKVICNDNVGDFDTVLISALKSKGISVDVGTGDVTVVSPLQSPAVAGSALQTAIQSGTNIQTAANGILSQLNMGQYDNPGAASFFANPDNNAAIQQAYNLLGYGVPTTTDAVGVSTMLKLYWGAFYLKQYPIPPSSPDSCNQIKESIEGLTNERANIQTDITQMAANPANEFYATYSSQDLQFQSAVVSDLLNQFNGLSSKNACTSVIAAGGGGGGASNPSSASNFSLILLLGAIVVVVIIAHKIISKNKSDN